MTPLFQFPALAKAVTIPSKTDFQTLKDLSLVTFTPQKVYIIFINLQFF